LTIQLNNLASIRTGLVLARKKAKLDSIDKIEYEQISLKSFGNGIKIDNLQNDTFISAQKIDRKYLTQKGDIIVRLRAPNFALYIEKDDENLLIHSLLAVIRVKSDKINPKYLAYYINSRFAQKDLKQNVKGTTISMLKTADLENLKVVLPPLQEQNKLVKFLELADKERELLNSIIQEKEKLSQSILDKIILQNKE